MNHPHPPSPEAQALQAVLDGDDETLRQTLAGMPDGALEDLRIAAKKLSKVAYQVWLDRP